MDLLFIDGIIEEVDVNCSEGLQDCSDESAPINDDFEVKDEMVLQLLQEMNDDQALGSLHGQIEKCRGQVSELSRKLGFITECGKSKGKKNTPSSKELACGRFHESLMANLPEVTTITGSPQLSLFLCLRVFKRILSPPPVFESTPIPTQIHSQEELDIISYIGGSVVSKVKKFSKRLHVRDKAQYLDILSYLIAIGTEASENTALIDCLDRGGLTRVKPQVVHMFITMEDIFVHMFNDKTHLSVNAFIKECGKHEDILCGYYETVYDSNSDDLAKEHIVNKMLQLYFTIRVHQKCRVYMDKVRYKTLTSKKQKSLRKKLKT